uniref:Uncharacterized protein n=1 Tax=Rhizophora mucronata TaxID=61149 RepID=A0A2P2N6U3_RHIMU
MSSYLKRCIQNYCYFNLFDFLVFSG